MALAKRIKARISGTYRYGERKLAPVVARNIRRGISEDIFKEQYTIDYFKNWIPYFEKMPLFAKTARVFGKHLASKILRVKKSDVYPTHDLRGKWLTDSFARDNDHLNFGGIKVAHPKGSKDEYFF